MAKVKTSGASSAELGDALESARADLVAAEAAVAEANEVYEANLIDDSPEQSKRRFEAKTDAAIALDRAGAMVRALEKRLAAAIEAEADAQRAELVARAKKLTAAARKRLEAEYGPAAETIRSLLRDTAEADLAVQEANAAALDGEPHLPRAEDFRSTPNRYRELVREEVVDLWVAVGDLNAPLADDLQRLVQPTRGPSRGSWSDATTVDDALGYGVVHQASGPLYVIKRRFRKRSILPNQSGRYAAPLAETIALPALHAGGTPFWEPNSRDPHDAIRNLDKPRIDRPDDPERAVEFEYELVR